MPSAPLDHDAIARTIALSLADYTTWDSPPQLYWLIADGAEVRLELAEHYSEAIATMMAMDKHTRVPETLRRIADQLAKAIFADPAAPIAPAAAVGAAVLTTVWAVEQSTDLATLRDPSSLAAAAQAVNAEGGGDLGLHAERVEVAQIEAVTVDDHHHYGMWTRGGMAPQQSHHELKSAPFGKQPKALRRLARILARRTPAT